MDCSLPGSSVCGIFQARILEQAAISYFSDLPDSGIVPVSLASAALGSRFFTTALPKKTYSKDRSTSVSDSVSRGFVLVVKDPPANAGDIRDAGLIPGLGRYPGGWHSNPLQYSCLENPMDRRA